MYVSFRDIMKNELTLIIILIDGKWYCSFNGDLQQWKHERFFKVINPKLQTSITELTGVQPPVRTKQLKIFANVHSELDMTLALFCYDMKDPTRQRIEKDMYHYQVERYQKKSKD